MIAKIVALTLLSAFACAQPTAAIILSDPDLSFGTSVAAAGDVDGDGVRDILVGCPDGGAQAAGFARVFSGVDGHVIRTINGVSPSDRFGTAVAGIGDVNGDGFADVVVGATKSGYLQPFQSPLQYWVFPPGYVRSYSGATGAVIHSWPGTATHGPNISMHFTGYGRTVAAVGDIDSDGITDILTAARGNGSFFPGGYCYYAPIGAIAGLAEIRSGATGAILRQHAGLSGDPWPTWVSSAGDVDGDGIGDYILAGRGSLSNQQDCGFGGMVSNPFHASRIEVRSGATGSILQTHLSDPLTEITAAAAGDVNGDSRGDIVGRASGPLIGTYGIFTGVFAGPSGAFIHTYTESTSGVDASCCGIGDWNGDGDDDFVLGEGALGRARIFSGRYGSLLHLLTGSPGFGRACSSLGDLDGDGRQELAVAGRGTVAIYWGTTLPAAQLTFVSPGCGPSLTAPQLQFSGPPILGSTILISYLAGSPGASGQLLAGLPAPSPINLGGGCLVHLDPLSFVLLGLVSLDAAGSWTTAISLPFLPAAAGLPVRVQAFAAPAPSPIGIELTSAWDLVFGY